MSQIGAGCKDCKRVREHVASLLLFNFLESMSDTPLCVRISVWKQAITYSEPEKERSQAEKIGRLKYNHQLLKQTLLEIEKVKLMLSTIFAGLKDSFNFEQSLIERVACEDDVDRDFADAL